ncbi:MAG: hypothetical protein Kow0063_20680 [Anaerolineae bacterium]
MKIIVWGRLSSLPACGADFPVCQPVGQTFQSASLWDRLSSLPAWYARLFAACVVGYAFSPIDLIPDPIPVLGYLDDLILIPLGITVALKMIPPPILAECREKARIAIGQGQPVNRLAGVIVVILWLLLGTLAVIIVTRAFH